jgi:propionate catabolism operon transcriptional regulator
LQALTPAFVLKLAPELSANAINTLPTLSSIATGVTPKGQAHLAQVLADFDGNRTAAAEHLGISRTTLWRRLRQAD